MVLNAPLHSISVARLRGGGRYRFYSPRARVLSAERGIVGAYDADRQPRRARRAARLVWAC